MILKVITINFYLIIIMTPLEILEIANNPNNIGKGNDEYRIILEEYLNELGLEMTQQEKEYFGK